MTMPTDLLAYNRKLIEQYRADGGASLGDRPLLLLTTVGRRTGKDRTSPMMYVQDGDRLLVIASNNGAVKEPEWYLNLRANPSVTVEVAGQEYRARATSLDEPEYAEKWTGIKEKYPFFAEHEERAEGRRIPVVALVKAD